MAREASNGISLARKWKPIQTLRHRTAPSNQHYTIVAPHEFSIMRQRKTIQPLRCTRAAKSSRYSSIIDARGNIIVRQYRPLKPYVVHELPSQSSRHHTIVGILGSGGTGNVLLAVHKERWQAIKVFKKEFKGRAECDIQPGLRHPNIVEPDRAFIYKNETHIVYELCANGSLRDLVQWGPVPEDVASPMFVQLMGAIKYMHSKGVMHRDIKPDNILLDAAMNIKITDFSHAAYTQSDSAQAVCGTLGYMAPEMFSSQPKGCEVDIWGAGVVFYCVLSGGLLPFYASGCEASCCKMSGRCKSIPDKHNEEIREKICAYEYQWPEPFPVVAKGLIERLLVVAKSRPTPDDIVEDPFFTSQELGTQNLHRENCELAGIGRNEMGDLFPCAGRRERLPGSFWVSLF